MALARERALMASPADSRTVGISAFENAGSEEFAPLGKGLAAMMIENLSALDGVKVLEREEVQALVDEAGLSETGLVAATTAVRAGKLLRAGKVAAGSHMDTEGSPRRLKIAAVLVGVEEGKQLARAEEDGLAEEFYELVPKISAAFVPVLVGKLTTGLPAGTAARVREEHTRSLPAALAFGRVLEAKDRRDGEAAEEECKRIEQLDPDFELARRTCAGIPPVWMSAAAIATASESLIFAASTGGRVDPKPGSIAGSIEGSGSASEGRRAAVGDDGVGSASRPRPSGRHLSAREGVDCLWGAETNENGDAIVRMQFDHVAECELVIGALDESLQIKGKGAVRAITGAFDDGECAAQVEVVGGPPFGWVHACLAQEDLSNALTAGSSVEVHPRFLWLLPFASLGLLADDDNGPQTEIVGSPAE